MGLNILDVKGRRALLVSMAVKRVKRRQQTEDECRSRLTGQSFILSARFLRSGMRTEERDEEEREKEKG